jgi:hypothetical protein
MRTLQLMADSLFDGCGGKEALTLLDSLSELREEDQKAALVLFHKVLRRLSTTGTPLSARSPGEMAEFEEALYRDLLDSMREAQVNSDLSEDARLAAPDLSTAKPIRRLALVSKDRTSGESSSHPLDFEEARRRRSARVN